MLDKIAIALLRLHLLTRVRSINSKRIYYKYRPQIFKEISMGRETKFSGKDLYVQISSFAALAVNTFLMAVISVAITRSNVNFAGYIGARYADSIFVNTVRLSFTSPPIIYLAVLVCAKHLDTLF